MPRSDPALSVVVVAFTGFASLEKCLNALMSQKNVHDLEIVVPYDDSLTGLADLRNKFPHVRFVSAGGHRTFAELRALGVANTRGSVVALTEDHCMPSPDWCERILQAHVSDFAAVGGAVEKTAPDSALDWALYFSDYARYMNPRAQGYSTELTDCNVSYKRSVLNAIVTVWELEFHEPAVNGALQATGQSLWFSPDIVVHQQRSVHLSEAIRDRYVFGRLFGSGRAERDSLPRRLFYGMMSFILPPLLVGRIAQHVFYRNRHVGIFLKSLPVLIALATVWSWGEFLGYMTGRADTSLTPQTKSATPKPQVRAIT